MIIAYLIYPIYRDISIINQIL